MFIYKVWCTENTAVGKMIRKDATNRKVYIDPHSLIRTRNFIIIMSFTGLFQRLGLSSLNINIICNFFN